MRYDSNPVGDQISILIQEPDMQADEDARDRLLADIEAAVEDVLDKHRCEPRHSKVIGGHVYTQIDHHCPECGGWLKMIEPTLDASNGAQATASRDCGWYGDAVYRLIDFYERESDTTINTDTDEPEQDPTPAIFDYISHVQESNVRPQYYPY